MGLVYADVGENLTMDAAFHSSGGENLTLKLYQSNTTPTNASVASDFTVASFGGYSNKTLTRTSFSAATTDSNGKASTAYAAQSWTATATNTPQIIYGYYVIGASTGTLYFAERFGASRTLNNGDNISVTIVVTGNSEN